MKAIIPVAGAGTRLRPLTYTQPKPLIPVAGKPILSFIIDTLIEQGVTEYLIILGYLGDKIKAFVEEKYPHLSVSYIYQEERLGSAHALWIGRHFFNDSDEVIIAFGDAIIDVDFSIFMKSPHSCIAIKRVTDPREFGIVELGNDNMITKVIEKPSIPKSNKAMVGIYKIKEVPQLIEALTYNIENNLHTDGEFHLTDAIMRMISSDISFSAIEVDNWFNCGKKEILLETNAIFLDREGYASVDLPPYDNTIIIHPVSIGKKCKLTHSIIGPHVTIGDNVEIIQSIISHSIVGNYSKLNEIILNKSVVGNDVSLSSAGQSLSIGDNTEIDFGHQ
ncbi:MAG: NTP transferase domain-containing protein [Saprospiraceae bacterium]|nr:NTP transferase domain-containing protein [Saprospiraceae bacterium]